MAEGYTLKEMVSKLLDQNSDMEARQIRLEEKVEQVLTQALKTNGRVTELEKRADRQDVKWAVVSGIVGLITFLGLPNVIQVIASSL